MEHYNRPTPAHPPRKPLPSLAPYTSKWKSENPNPKTRDGLLAKLKSAFGNGNGAGEQNYYGGGYPGMNMGYGMGGMYPGMGMGMGGMGMPMGGMGMPMGGMGMGGMGMYPGMMGGYGVSPSLCPPLLKHVPAITATHVLSEYMYCQKRADSQQMNGYGSG